MGCANSYINAEAQKDVDFSPVQPHLRDAEPASRAESREERSFHCEYLVFGKLGKGAFAHVYKAQKDDGSDESKYAVKITDLRTKTGPVTTDKKRHRQVEREISIMQKVAGIANCIHLVECFREARRSYIVMEMCECRLLDALRVSNVLNENRLRPYIAQMFKAACAIHRIRVVHRDMKPSNFLIRTVEGRSLVKLCDFGLASVMPGTDEDEALQGVCGTPPFMSPEMIRNEAYGAKADVWSLGVNLYILLCGKFPYTPIESTGRGMKQAVVLGGDVELQDKEMSKNARSLLAGLLNRDPFERLTACEALSHTWFMQDSGEVPCLKATLQAARKIGAFEEENSSKVLDNSPGTQDMERHIRNMQKKYRCGSPVSSKGSDAKKDFLVDSTSSTNSTATPKSGSSVSLDSPPSP